MRQTFFNVLISQSACLTYVNRIITFFFIQINKIIPFTLKILWSNSFTDSDDLHAWHLKFDATAEKKNIILLSIIFFAATLMYVDAQVLSTAEIFYTGYLFRFSAFQWIPSFFCFWQTFHCVASSWQCADCICWWCGMLFAVTRILHSILLRGQTRTLYMKRSTFQNNVFWNKKNYRLLFNLSLTTVKTMPTWISMTRWLLQIFQCSVSIFKKSKFGEKYKLFLVYYPYTNLSAKRLRESMWNCFCYPFSALFVAMKYFQDFIFKLFYFIFLQNTIRFFIYRSTPTPLGNACNISLLQLVDCTFLLVIQIFVILQQTVHSNDEMWPAA